MGGGISSFVSGVEYGGASHLKPRIGDIPESCAASVLMYLSLLEICKLARLNRAFHGAASADFNWESKLPENYRYLVEELLDESPENFTKKEIFARLSRRNPIDGGKKEIWLEKRTGGICVSISSKAMGITGIDDRRYWNYIPTEESRGNIFRGYRRLQEQLIKDIEDIGVLSRHVEKPKEVEFCPSNFENYVPCFNVSENEDRQCLDGLKQDCLVLPSMNYRVPLRWPTGRDVIWVGNVKITAQEVLSSGSLTKRMMMLEEDQVSFSSDPLMVDGVEDYSHQIAEMIGLRNESNFNQAVGRSAAGLTLIILVWFHRHRLSI